MKTPTLEELDEKCDETWHFFDPEGDKPCECGKFKSFKESIGLKEVKKKGEKMNKPTLSGIEKEFDKRWLPSIKLKNRPEYLPSLKLLRKQKAFYHKRVLEILKYLEMDFNHSKSDPLFYNQAVSELNKRIKKVKG